MSRPLSVRVLNSIDIFVPSLENVALDSNGGEACEEVSKIVVNTVAFRYESEPNEVATMT